MKYKLIASDFDGTLADNDHTVPKANIDAVRAYLKAGGIFTISSGRILESVIMQYNDAGFKGIKVPLVALQGAIIADSVTKETLHSVTMNRETIRKILRYCKANNLYCHYYDFSKFYVDTSCEWSIGYAKVYSGIKDCFFIVGDLEKYMDNNPGLPLCKMMIMDRPENLNGITDCINEYLQGEVTFCRSASVLTECVDNAAGKGNALRFLADMYKIKIEDTLAIGDSWNDATMIEAAGLGVVMQNAPEDLKKLGGYIADYNYNAGFSKVVRKVIKGEPLK